MGFNVENKSTGEQRMKGEFEAHLKLTLHPQGQGFEGIKVSKLAEGQRESLYKSNWHKDIRQTPSQSRREERKGQRQRTHKPRTQQIRNSITASK